MPTDDVVAELDRWLDEPAYVDTRERGREIERASTLIHAARDEIVALRKLTDGDWVWKQITDTRAEALEEAAQRCDKLATDYTIPMSVDNWSAGCRGCAGRIRALKKDEAALTVRSALLRRLRRCNPGAEGQGMRASGYYWVLFNWPLFDPTRAPEWQPASWDDVTSTWVVIGSRQEVPPEEPCILAVDERRIERPREASDG